MLIPTILAALLVPALAAPLEPRQSSSTRNELVNGPCRPVTVIYARGTSEAGNIGSIAGPPLESALDSRLGTNTVAFQGVDYAATIAGAISGGSSQGASTLASLVSTAMSKCPDTQIVLSGYRSVNPAYQNAC